MPSINIVVSDETRKTFNALRSLRGKKGETQAEYFKHLVGLAKQENKLGDLNLYFAEMENETRH